MEKTNYFSSDLMGRRTKYGSYRFRQLKQKKFKELTASRKEAIKNKIRILGNCSNKSHYSYKKGQVKKLFDEIQQYLEETRKKFEKS